MSLLETLVDVEDQALDTVKSAQGVTMEAARRLAKNASPWIPSRQAVVDNVFDFAGKVLETNRSFASQLSRAVSQLTSENQGARPRSTGTTKAT